MVNCLAAGGLREVYVQLLHTLSPTAAVDKNIVSNLEQLLIEASDDNGRGGMVLLVLDELAAAIPQNPRPNTPQTGGTDGRRRHH